MKLQTLVNDLIEERKEAKLTQAAYDKEYIKAEEKYKGKGSYSSAIHNRTHRKAGETHSEAKNRQEGSKEKAKTYKDETDIGKATDRINNVTFENVTFLGKTTLWVVINSGAKVKKSFTITSVLKTSDHTLLSQKNADHLQQFTTDLKQAEKDTTDTYSALSNGVSYPWFIKEYKSLDTLETFMSAPTETIQTIFRKIASTPQSLKKGLAQYKSFKSPIYKVEVINQDVNVVRVNDTSTFGDIAKDYAEYIKDQMENISHVATTSKNKEVTDALPNKRVRETNIKAADKKVTKVDKLNTKSEVETSLTKELSTVHKLITSAYPAFEKQSKTYNNFLKDKENKTALKALKASYEKASNKITFLQGKYTKIKGQRDGSINNASTETFEAKTDKHFTDLAKKIETIDLEKAPATSILGAMVSKKINSKDGKQKLQTEILDWIKKEYKTIETSNPLNENEMSLQYFMGLLD